MGADDERAASVDELVAAPPRGTKAMAPENHRTAASSPEFAAGIVDFLSDTPCPRLQ
jgi:hypothetical protein